MVNHAILDLAVNDLASPNLGRAVEASAPRLIQFDLKLQYLRYGPTDPSCAAGRPKTPDNVGGYEPIRLCVARESSF